MSPPQLRTGIALERDLQGRVCAERHTAQSPPAERSTACSQAREKITIKQNGGSDLGDEFPAPHGLQCPHHGPRVGSPFPPLWYIKIDHGEDRQVSVGRHMHAY